MSAGENLLVELLVEELPPKVLKKLGEAFAKSVYEGLKSRKLLSPHSAAIAFASPRRLAVHITTVADVAPDEEITEKLMPVSIAIKDNKPTDALRKRLAKAGRESLADLWPNAQDGSNKLFVKNDDKAEAIYLSSLAKGLSLLVGLQSAIEQAIEDLPIPKVMSYQLVDGWHTVNFVRPAHGLLVLHGADIIPIHLLGIAASGLTQGHRFEARTHTIEIRDADSYEKQLLEEGAVIASFEKRRTEIECQLETAAQKEGLMPIKDGALLDEVTALVERPNVLLGQFEKTYLEVPPECLILTMKANQKYFPLLDASGKLTNKFLIVSNISPKDANAVIGGNERVVRPRLADAKFFFDQDRKKTLESRISGLDKVVYHNKLGTQGERTERVRKIARWVAEKLGTDPRLADRAAQLAKADLLTDMVGEFPELQGIMGGYYARHDGENELVVAAIADQYVVRRDDEEDASNLVSDSLLIADRIETLVGIWAIGLKPTGEKDPFALRRHALGVIRSFSLCHATARHAGEPFKLRLDELLEFAASTFSVVKIESHVLNEIREFIFERYRNQLAGYYNPQTLDAVISLNPELHEVILRSKAVKAFEQLPAAESLAAANKRVGNILKKAGGEMQGKVDASLLKEPAEIALDKALLTIKPKADEAFERGDYTASLQELAALKDPVDAFFDGVMVNAEDKDLRNNRLALLAQLHAAMNRVADISKLAT